MAMAFDSAATRVPVSAATRCRHLPARVLVELARLHDHGEVLLPLDQRDVLERVALHQQEVGDEAFLHPAELVAHAHQLRAHDRRTAQRLGGRVAEIGDEVLDVAGVLAHRRHREAIVAADHDANAALPDLVIGRTSGVELAVEMQRLADLGRDPDDAALLGAVVDEAEGRADEGSVLHALQEIERLLVGEVAVVDAVDAVPDRHLHALRRAGVRRHQLAHAVRRLDHRSQLGIGQGRDLGPGVADELVARDVDLDRVDAVANALPDHAAHLVRPIRDEPEALLVDVALALVAQARRHCDLRAAGAHPGAGDEALGDGVPGGDAQERLGRCRLEDAGEAVVEQQAAVLGGQEHVALGRNDAELRRGMDAGKGGMAVPLDHAGHQRHAGAVDDGGRFGGNGLAAPGDRRDPLAFDRNVAREHFRGFAVEDGRIPDHDAVHDKPPPCFCAGIVAAAGRLQSTITGRGCQPDG
jgi:hypothetical protein